MKSILSGRLNKLLLLLVSALMLLVSAVPAPVFAYGNPFGFAPNTYKEGYNYGNGVYFAPYSFTVYEKPDPAAPVIGNFSWSHKSQSNGIAYTDAEGNPHRMAADHLFLCFYPELDVAMVAVTGDDGSGWAEVVYDQAKQKTGWVRLKEQAKPTAEAKAESLAPLDTGEPAHFGIYQTWQEFMKLNAKASGVYWLSGVDQYNRSIRTSDADDAKLLDITIIRSLKVKHIRGNWMLVEVLDFERNTPIGWVRWRDDEGNLMVFPNITNQHLPIVTTTY